MWEALKSACRALPYLARALWFWLTRWRARERSRARDEADEVAGGRGPGAARRCGRKLRDLMRDTEP